MDVDRQTVLIYTDIPLVAIRLLETVTAVTASIRFATFTVSFGPFPIAEVGN